MPAPAEVADRRDTGRQGLPSVDEALLQQRLVIVSFMPSDGVERAVPRQVLVGVDQAG